MTLDAAAEAARAAAAAGLHEIVLPVPYGPGGITCWLVEDDPLTLVDVGANWCTSFLELERGLAERGRRVEDLERVVLTHHHNDHAGAVEMVLDRSGAELVALSALAPWLADQVGCQVRDDRYRVRTMERHGAPSVLCRYLEAANRSFTAWGCDAEVARPLEDGDELVFAGRTWKVLARPGHSYRDTVFLDAERAIALMGDHLLPEFASNPYVNVPPDGREEDVPTQLIVYRESLRQTRALELELALPGHGHAFSNHRELIDRREADVVKLKAKISALLSRGSATAYEVSTALWARGTAVRPEATMCTVLGHLAVLLEAGEVAMSPEGDVFRFELV